MRGIISLIALLACLGSFACKQGEGERCQVVDDCEDGLDCVGPTDNKTCERSGGGDDDDDVVDAAPRPDAPSVVDAAPEPDADPAPDAASVDAALPDATPAPDAA